MINIKIKPSRLLITCGRNFIGLTGEKNATILHFEKPDRINGDAIGNYDMRLVFNNSAGSFFKTADEHDCFSITSDLTSDVRLKLSVQFLKGNQVKWESLPTEFIFARGINDSNINITTELVNQLAAALTEITGEDYTDYTFEQLIEVLPTICSSVDIDEIKSALNTLVPSMHFGLMNDDDFKDTVVRFVDKYISCPESEKILSVNASPLYDDSGQFVDFYRDTSGTIELLALTETVVPQIELTSAISQTKQTIMSQIINILVADGYDVSDLPIVDTQTGASTNVQGVVDVVIPDLLADRDNLDTLLSGMEDILGIEQEVA